MTVTVYSDPVACSTIANGQGAWSCTLPADLPAGAHTVRVTVLNPGETVARELGPYAVTVNGESPVVTTSEASSRGGSSNAASPIRRTPVTANTNDIAVVDTSETQNQTTASTNDGASVEDVIAEPSYSWVWLWMILGAIAALGLLIYVVARRRSAQNS